MGRAWMLLGMLLSAGTTSAQQPAGHWTVATEWIDRGISQTAGRPAMQGGLELATEAGIYLGAWGSNVDFGGCCSESVQLDWTVGVSRPWGAMVWDAGLTRSSFPGTSENLDSTEYHFGVNWRNYGFGVAWTPDFGNLGCELWYFAADGAFELPWRGLRLSLHAGYSRGNALRQRFADETRLEPYGEWQVALERDFGLYTATLAWADTDMGGEFRNRDRVEHNDGRLFFALSQRIP